MIWRISKDWSDDNGQEIWLLSIQEFWKEVLESLLVDVHVLCVFYFVFVFSNYFYFFHYYCCLFFSFSSNWAKKETVYFFFNIHWLAIIRDADIPYHKAIIIGQTDKLFVENQGKNTLLFFWFFLFLFSFYLFVLLLRKFVVKNLYEKKSKWKKINKEYKS